MVFGPDIKVSTRTNEEVNMLKTIEAMGSALLGRLVPRLEASAACWGACWQCNKLYGHQDGVCNCNAPCCSWPSNANRFSCNCLDCP
ncbi:hypothetical protein [Micromonospora peucetia]|uniref:Uncharacterized protein n=1 Tax=Micromonospora peucetia TaxID=47871 RepID=A0A1C6VUU7_9ACTN|nr:hypothetical protein [Micromonospora peucetia]SCL69874.1 hypothetical protein GA0070608_4159 [Micromonospora peucetia]